LGIHPRLCVALHPPRFSLETDQDPLAGFSKAYHPLVSSPQLRRQDRVLAEAQARELIANAYSGPGNSPTPRRVGISASTSSAMRVAASRWTSR